MGILLKNTLRSIESNKGQTFVIVITVMIVAAMLFIAFSMSDIFFHINMAEYDRVAQGADLLLGENLGSIEFFSEARLKSLLDPKDIESVFYFAKFNTILKTETDSITVLLEGTDLNYYLEQRDIEYADKFDENTKDPDIAYQLIGGYSTIIVGESFAKKNSLTVGQSVEVYVPTYNKYVVMIIEYIAKNEGIFSSPADKNILVDFSAIGNQGQVNAVYFNFVSKDLYAKYYDLFETHFPAIRVGEGNDISRVQEIVKNNTTLLVLGLLFLVATMLFILLTSYLVIVRNRMSEMVIFKAVGATQANVFAILLMEVLFYSVVGSVLGLMLGRIAMGFAAYTLLPLVHKAINYAFWKYLLTFLLSISISLLATSFPIYSTSKKTIRHLLSSSGKHASEVKIPLFIFSTLLMLSFVILYVFLPSKYILIASLLVALATIFWVYCSVSIVTKFVSWLARKFSSGTGLVALSGISIRRNKAIRTVTLMIAIITFFSFLVFQVIGLVNYAVVPYRTRYTADFVVNSSYDVNLADTQLDIDELSANFDVNPAHTASDSYSRIAEMITKIDGVEEAGYFNSSKFVIPGTDSKEWNVYGVDKFETLQYCSSGIEGLTKEIWEATPYGIVLSNDMLLRLDKNIGDVIHISPLMTDYDEDVYDFVVLGIDHTITEYDRVGYCKFQEIEHIKEGAFFLIQSDNQRSKTQVFMEIRNLIEGLSMKECYALTYHEWALSQHENLTGVSLLLKILQVLIYIIGVIGILNMSVVTVYDRQNEIKLYTISGMSREEYISFSLSEGFLISCIGGFIGLVISYSINLIIPIFASVIDKYVSINYFPTSLLLLFGSSLVLFSVIWMGIAFFNRRTKSYTINERLFE